MCGINGFNFQNEDLIKKMNNKVRHRGPDDEGVYIDEDISLGHRRLSIIDLSPNGRQPIYNENKNLTIVFNGEIYNYRELREELSARHKFTTKTDTEVIIHLYEEMGAKCLEKLNGIFTFAIWDKKNKKLFLARDRIGVKPLYYYHNNGQFIFSSEIKAILEHESVKRAVNKDSFNHFFKLGFVPQPLTMFEGIYKLESAHYLVLENKQIRISKYWQVNDFENIKSEEEIKEKISELINDSVKRQLISDRPVGIFLSGGIDSNVLLGVASKYVTGKIKTYSVGFEEHHGDKFNADYRLAEESAKHFQTDHHQLIINEKDIIKNLPDIIYQIDEPINNAVHTAVYLLARLAKEEVAVDLSGAGGDELFGGYPRYYYNTLIDKWQFWTKWLPAKTILKIAEKITGKKLIEKFEAKNLDRYKQFMFRPTDDIKKVVRSEVYDEEATDDFYNQKYFGDDYKAIKNKIGGDFTKYSSMLDRQTWMLDFGLVLGDKLTMASGLEERVPLLDHRLVELSAKIPTKYKIKGKVTKNIYKEAMKEYIAPHILNETKRGFTAPISEWLRTGLYDFAKEILSEDYCPATKEFFDFEQVNKIFEDHVHKRKYNLNLIWGIITWQIWYKTFIDQSIESENNN